jgi:signal transduction histidine kinase
MAFSALDFNRIKLKQFKPNIDQCNSIKAVIESVVDFQRGFAEQKGVRLEFVADFPTIPVSLDQQRTQQIVSDLVINSIMRS